MLKAGLRLDDAQDAPSQLQTGAPSFIRSDLGLIPAGWRVVHLAREAKLESGHTPSRRMPEYWGGEIPWVSLHDSTSLDEKEIHTTAQTVTSEGIANSSARLLPKGTVIFSRTATVGKATVLGRPMATSQDFACYICGPEVHNHFLVYLFRFMAPEWKRLMAGSIHNTVYMPTFRSLRIALPPKPEQEAIASALSDIDDLIASLWELITKKKAIRHSAMEDLLSARSRLPGFSSPWSRHLLGELFAFKNGLSKEKRFFGYGTPMVNYMDVFATPQLQSDELAGRVSVTSTERENFSIRKGDVFFTRTSETVQEIGLSAVMMDDAADAVFSGFVLRARPRTDVLVDAFKAYCFRTKAVRRQIVATASYTTRALTNGRLLAAIQLVAPDKKEQQAIADVLADMDDELAALQRRLAKSRKIRSGMMQELLTGRVRLA